MSAPMSHQAPPASSKPASVLWSAALVLLLATTWLLLVFSGDGTRIRSLFQRSTTARLAQRGQQLAQGITQPPPAGRLHPMAPLPVCKLLLDQGPFATNCTALRNVCVDQGRIILYNPRHRPRWTNGPPIGIPKLAGGWRSGAYHYTYREAAGMHDNVKNIHAGLPTIHVRPATAREPRRYLAQPAFSSCTVPVVWYPMNGFNFAHALKDNGAVMYSALKETPFAEHVRMVPMTGEGLAVSPTNRLLWQPLTRMRLEAWDEFSVRLPDDSVGAPPAGGGLPRSYEGGEQRCFRHMFVCSEDLSQVVQDFRLYSYAQQLVQQYQSQLSGQQAWEPEAQQHVQLDDNDDEHEDDEEQQGKPTELPPQPQPEEQQGEQQTEAERQAEEQQQAEGPPAELTDGRPQPPVSLLRSLGPEFADSSQTGAGTKVRLRIVFQKRDGIERQLVNAAELVKLCNRWRYKVPSGALVTALCWQAEMPSLAAGMATAQQADIMIGVHGANLANAYMMRPFSSAVELTMYQFEENPAHGSFAKQNYKDKETQLQWWKLLMCDPASSIMSVREKEERGNGTVSRTDWPKYRNMRVRWEALETVLRAVVDTAGDMEAYWQRWRDGHWWWLVSAKGTVFAGPEYKNQTCRRARQEGMIT